MIKLTFHTLDNTTPAANGKTVYQQFRYDLIRNAEGTVPNVYLDTNNQNLPTIGIGFNLTDPGILNSVLEKFGVIDTASKEAIKIIVNAPHNSLSALQTALNTKLGQLASHNPPLANRTTFAFTSGQAGINEMSAVFDGAVLTYDNSNTNIGPLGRVDNWLAGIPPSKERAVLVSLSYNGVLGDNLKTAIQNGDRAAAWYEIAFASNKTRGFGTENRRFQEAETFGLFKGQKPTAAKAEAIFKSLTSHYGDM